MIVSSPSLICSSHSFPYLKVYLELLETRSLAWWFPKHSTETRVLLFERLGLARELQQPQLRLERHCRLLCTHSCFLFAASVVPSTNLQTNLQSSGSHLFALHEAPLHFAVLELAHVGGRAPFALLGDRGRRWFR